MLASELGIGHDPGQHAAYVESWVKILEDEPGEIRLACADAKKAHDMVLGFEKEREQSADFDSGGDCSEAGR